MGYFDITRDLTYPCFCEACLVGKPLKEISAEDSRYCITCHSYMNGDHDTLEAVSQKNLKVLARNEECAYSKFKSPGSTRGRKSISLPLKTVLELLKEGLGVKVIAKRLRHQGIECSAMTVHRFSKRMSER